MKIILKLALSFFTIVFIINIYVVLSTKNKIIKNTKKISNNIDCILVLGAGIKKGKPSPMLEDRLLTAIDLYNAKVAPKLVVSGDHTEKDYDEVNVMKNYLIEKGIPSEDIFMDHAGISTYDSIYRINKVFKAHKIVIVTQKYHLYRSLYIAKELDVKSYGVSASKVRYIGQTQRDIREIAARIKDFIKCIYKPTSTHLGEVINLKGSGDTTNDD